jgi:uncharacterized protein YggE
LSNHTKVQPSIVDQTDRRAQAVHGQPRGAIVEQTPTAAPTSSRQVTGGPTTITVQGTFSAFYPAERATVAVAVHHESSTRPEAFAATLEAAETVRATIRALEATDSGVIARWSSNNVQVWNDRPWLPDGGRGEQVFHTREEFSVTFAEFARLAPWIEAVAAVEGTSVDSIEWSLTAGRRTGATTEVRSRAVQDAMTKATVYAQALGLGSVRAIAVADPGMLGDQVHGAPREQAMFSRVSSVADSGEARLSLVPERIEVSAAVDARFAAE